MHLRRDRQKVGKRTHTYLSIAQAITEEGPKGKRSKPIVMANLGNEANIEEKHARQLMRSLEKYIAERWGEKPTSEEVKQAARVIRKRERELRMITSRAFGLRMLLEAAWRELGVGKALAAFAAQRRIEFDFERVMFTMVLNRMSDPKSKHACNFWAKERAYLPEAKGWDVQHYYRALDVLHDHWEELEKVLETHLWKGLSPEERMLRLVDTTSLYFEARQNDKELKDLADANPDVRPPRRRRPEVVNVPAFRMQGHNKDGHPGDPQVVIATECTVGGYVLSHKTYPGNTSDTTVTKDLLTRLPRPKRGVDRVFVTDAGMLSAELMAEIDAAGWKRLSAEGPRKSKVGQAMLRSVPGRYLLHGGKPHMGFKVKDMTAAESPSGKAERWVATRNEREQERQLARIERHVDKTAEILAKQKVTNGTHPRSVCAVASHMTLRKYVMPSTKVTGTFILNPTTIRREKMLAGVRFYRTTKLDWDAEAIYAAYTSLQDVEANHKLFKGPLALQPCYHRTTEHIEAHVMLTILTGNCVRHLERLTSMTFGKLHDLFGGLMVAEMADGDERFWQRGELNEEQEEVLERLGISVPPHEWAISIEGFPTKPPSQKRLAKRNTGE
ncbi:MAG: transposase [Cyanobacteria bacterium RYN_339]|nr:transposase [Cyanobacteria bacterium RYN_339]